MRGSSLSGRWTEMPGLRLITLTVIALVTLSAPAAAKKHTVAKGDALISIAKTYGCKVKALKRAKALQEERLSGTQIISQ